MDGAKKYGPCVCYFSHHSDKVYDRGHFREQCLVFSSQFQEISVHHSEGKAYGKAVQSALVGAQVSVSLMWESPRCAVVTINE